jgi:hypothetical protein
LQKKKRAKKKEMPTTVTPPEEAVSPAAQDEFEILERDEQAREALEAKLRLLEQQEAPEQNEIDEEFGPGTL